MPLIAPPPFTAAPATRPLGVGAAVLAVHLGALWLLTQGLAPTPPEIIVPAEMLAQVQAPAPRPAPPAPAVAPPPPKPTPQPTPQPPKPAPAPSPAPASTPVPAPMPAAAPSPAPAAAAATSAPASASPAAPPAAPSAAAPSAPPAPAPVQLPSTNADYLQNPKPPYPPASLRLGESGRVVHRVWIGPDGRPQKAELVKSSGYPRLDKAAHDAVMGWRYVPGKRGGVPELMAFDVPIVWELPN